MLGRVRIDDELRAKRAEAVDQRNAFGGRAPDRPDFPLARLRIFFAIRDTSCSARRAKLGRRTVISGAESEAAAALTPSRNSNN